MIPESEIHQHLAEITDSKTFSRSNINVNLLQYLVKATLANDEIKEFTIGNEIFGKDYDPIKNDTKVRVYIYNLRKKLQQYYETESPKSKLRFKIEKGQYKVNFERREEPLKKPKRNTQTIIASFSVLILLAVITIVVISAQESYSLFWKDYFTNGHPTRLIIGDHFIITGEVPTRSKGMFRDSRINSIQDFNEYIKQNPEQASEIGPTPFAYVTKMGVVCSSIISKYFTENSQVIETSINSEWDINEINTHNIIYVGQKKNLRFLKAVFMDLNPQYKEIDTKIRRVNPEGKEEIYTSQASKPNVDYTIVSKFNREEDTQLSFFLSEHDIGTIKMVKFFTNTDSIKNFYRQHQLEDKNFSALFKVSGWKRTGLKKELVAIDIIK